MIECVGHLVDAELVVATRVRWILAEDEPDIVGYDQDRWVDALRHRDADPGAVDRLLRRGPELEPAALGGDPGRGPRTVRAASRARAGELRDDGPPRGRSRSFPPGPGRACPRGGSRRVVASDDGLAGAGDGLGSGHRRHGRHRDRLVAELGDGCGELDARRDRLDDPDGRRQVVEGKDASGQHRARRRMVLEGGAAVPRAAPRRRRDRRRPPTGARPRRSRRGARRRGGHSGRTGTRARRSCRPRSWRRPAPGRRPCRPSCTRSRAGRCPPRPPRRRSCGPRTASRPARRGAAGRRSRRTGTVLPAIASPAAVDGEVGLRARR